MRLGPFGLERIVAAIAVAGMAVPFEVVLGIAPANLVGMDFARMRVASVFMRVFVWILLRVGRETVASDHGTTQRAEVDAGRLVPMGGIAVRDSARPGEHGVQRMRFRVGGRHKARQFRERIARGTRRGAAQPAFEFVDVDRRPR